MLPWRSRGGQGNRQGVLAFCRQLDLTAKPQFRFAEPQVRPVAGSRANPSCSFSSFPHRGRRGENHLSGEAANRFPRPAVSPPHANWGREEPEQQHGGSGSDPPIGDGSASGCAGTDAGAPLARRRLLMASAGGKGRGTRRRRRRPQRSGAWEHATAKPGGPGTKPPIMPQEAFQPVLAIIQRTTGLRRSWRCLRRF